MIAREGRTNDGILFSFHLLNEENFPAMFISNEEKLLSIPNKYWAFEDMSLFPQICWTHNFRQVNLSF